MEFIQRVMRIPILAIVLSPILAMILLWKLSKSLVKFLLGYWYCEWCQTQYSYKEKRNVESIGYETEVVFCEKCRGKWNEY